MKLPEFVDGYRPATSPSSPLLDSARNPLTSVEPMRETRRAITGASGPGAEVFRKVQEKYLADWEMSRGLPNDRLAAMGAILEAAIMYRLTGDEGQMELANKRTIGLLKAYGDERRIAVWAEEVAERLASEAGQSKLSVGQNRSELRLQGNK